MAMLDRTEMQTGVHSLISSLYLQQTYLFQNKECNLVIEAEAFSCISVLGSYSLYFVTFAVMNSVPHHHYSDEGVQPETFFSYLSMAATCSQVGRPAF